MAAFQLRRAARRTPASSGLCLGLSWGFEDKLGLEAASSAYSAALSKRSDLSLPKLCEALRDPGAPALDLVVLASLSGSRLRGEARNRLPRAAQPASRRACSSAELG
jgi:hypothetical protein